MLRLAQVPNILTAARFVAVPMFVVAFIQDWRGVALTLFATAGITDLVDGYIARKYDVRTRLGAMLDPIADKLLMAATFLCLALSGAVPWEFVILMLVKDAYILAGVGLFTYLKYPFTYSAVWWSKATTLCLIVVASLALLEYAFPGLSLYVYPIGDFVYGGFWVTAVLIVVTMLEYTRRALELLHAGRDASCDS